MPCCNDEREEALPDIEVPVASGPAAPSTPQPWPMPGPDQQPLRSPSKLKAPKIDYPSAADQSPPVGRWWNPPLTEKPKKSDSVQQKVKKFEKLSKK